MIEIHNGHMRTVSGPDLPNGNHSCRVYRTNKQVSNDRKQVRDSRKLEGKRSRITGYDDVPDNIVEAVIEGDYGEPYGETATEDYIMVCAALLTQYIVSNMPHKVNGGLIARFARGLHSTYGAHYFGFALTHCMFDGHVNYFGESRFLDYYANIDDGDNDCSFQSIHRKLESWLGPDYVDAILAVHRPDWLCFLAHGREAQAMQDAVYNAVAGGGSLDEDM